jgi:hypothetical protein
MNSGRHSRSTFPVRPSWSLGKDEHSACRYVLKSMVEVSLRQRLVLDRTEHAGTIRLVGESITRAVSVTPAACPNYWWQNIRPYFIRD